MIDLTADVYRTHLGDVVQWQYGKEMRVGTVTAIKAEDAFHIDTKSLFAHSGEYMGRLVTIDCAQPSCRMCSTVGKPPGHVDEFGNKWWGHYCCECQLSDVTLSPLLENVQALNGALF